MAKKKTPIDIDAAIDEEMANEEPLTDLEIEQLFGWNPYDGWELVEMGVGGYTVQYKIAFRIPPKEEDWLYKYLFYTPSRLVPLYEFVHNAPKAFADIICLEADGWQVQNLTPDDWRSWAIHATGELVEEALQQMIDDGEVPNPKDEAEATEAEATRAARTTTNPKVTQRQKDTEAAFIYLQQLHYDHVDNPMPDCLTGNIRALPHNRFLRSLAQLWGSINLCNTKKQRFTYWMLYHYDFKQPIGTT